MHRTRRLTLDLQGIGQIGDRLDPCMQLVEHHYLQRPSDQGLREKLHKLLKPRRPELVVLLDVLRMRW